MSQRAIPFCRRTVVVNRDAICKSATRHQIYQALEYGSSHFLRYLVSTEHRPIIFKGASNGLRRPTAAGGDPIAILSWEQSIGALHQPESGFDAIHNGAASDVLCHCHSTVITSQDRVVIIAKG